MSEFMAWRIRFGIVFESASSCGGLKRGESRPMQPATLRAPNRTHAGCGCIPRMLRRLFHIAALAALVHKKAAHSGSARRGGGSRMKAAECGRTSAASSLALARMMSFLVRRRRRKRHPVRQWPDIYSGPCGFYRFIYHPHL